MVAVMWQHVPEPYSHFFNVEDAMMFGPQTALDKCKDSFQGSNEYGTRQESSKASWWSKISRSGSDTGKDASLCPKMVKAQAREHAAALLCRSQHWTEQMLPQMLRVVQAVASPLAASMLQTSSDFPCTRKGVLSHASVCS